MDRRQFISGLAFIPFTNDLIKSRKDTQTLDLQILMIRSLWELSKKANYGMWIHFPMGYWQGEHYHTITKLQIHGIFEKTILVELTERNNDLSDNFKWLDSNLIHIDKLPEVINFWGNMWPIVEIFRLDIPKFKFSFTELVDWGVIPF